MRHLIVPTALFVGGLIGSLVCLFEFLDGNDLPMEGCASILCIALGFRELRFELDPQFRESE